MQYAICSMQYAFLKLYPLDISSRVTLIARTLFCISLPPPPTVNMRPATKGYNNFMRQAPEETECFHLIQLLFFNRPSIMSDYYFSVVCLALLCKAGRPHIKFIRGPGLMREQDLYQYIKRILKNVV